MPEIPGGPAPLPVPIYPEPLPKNDSGETQWRAKALEAQEKIGELESSIGKLRSELESTRGTLDAMTRRREVETQLIEAKARDVETALLLVEQALAKQPEADVGKTVADLRARKPHLFDADTPPPRTPAAMGASPSDEYPSAVERAFKTARAAGGRRSLLDYLRAKRRG